MTYYGNGWRELRSVLIVGLIMGAVVDCVAVGVSLAHGWDNSRSELLVYIGLLPPAVLGLVVGLTIPFSIRIADGRVEKMLFRRYVLKSLRASDYERCTFLPVVLHFKHGKRMGVTAHLDIVSKLDRDLCALRRAATD